MSRVNWQARPQRASRIETNWSAPSPTTVRIPVHLLPPAYRTRAGMLLLAVLTALLVAIAVALVLGSQPTPPVPMTLECATGFEVEPMEVHDVSGRVSACRGLSHAEAVRVARFAISASAIHRSDIRRGVRKPSRQHSTSRPLGGWWMRPICAHRSCRSSRRWDRAGRYAVALRSLRWWLSVSRRRNLYRTAHPPGQRVRAGDSDRERPVKARNVVLLVVLSLVAGCAATTQPTGSVSPRSATAPPAMPQDELRHRRLQPMDALRGSRFADRCPGSGARERKHGLAGHSSRARDGDASLRIRSSWPRPERPASCIATDVRWGNGGRTGQVARCRRRAGPVPPRRPLLRRHDRSPVRGPPPRGCQGNRLR